MAASASSSLECRLVGDWLVVGWLIVSRPAVRSDATTCGPQRERGGGCFVMSQEAEVHQALVDTRSGN